MIKVYLQSSKYEEPKDYQSLKINPKTIKLNDLLKKASEKFLFKVTKLYSVKSKKYV